MSDVEDWEEEEEEGEDSNPRLTPSGVEKSRYLPQNAWGPTELLIGPHWPW